MFNVNKQSGFFKLIILIIIAVIALGYFGFDLREIVNSPKVQDNLQYSWSIVTFVWFTYLSEPAKYIWNDVFIRLLWDNFIINMDRLKNNQATTLEEMAPETLPI